ncbi:MAG: MarC family protein [Desulfurococcales archaeon]|nr:MarC family protein [Desulfurococcales archaeon]
MEGLRTCIKPRPLAVQGMVELDLRPFIMLFVVLDPIGVSPYVYTILSRLPEDKRAPVLRRAVASAFIILVAFVVVGDVLLSILDVSIDDFRIATGLILLIYAAASLFEIQIGFREERDESIAVFPLATPLLAGPGAVSTVLYIKYTYSVVTAIITTTLVIIVTYPILAASSKTLKLLGRHGTLLIDKFMSLIMAGFAISIIREGIT